MEGKNWRGICAIIWMGINRLKEIMNDDILKNQEKNTEIQKLRSLLKSVSCAVKQEHEWQILENSIISRLEAQETRRIQSWGMLWVKDSIATVQKNLAPVSVAVCGCLIILAVIVSFNTGLDSKQLTDARIVGVQGAATCKTPEGKTVSMQDELRTAHENPAASVVFKNQVFETKADATLSVRLDKGTCVILSGNTTLSITEATTSRIGLFLHTGSILSAVSKRTKDQTFSILTPDACCNVIGTIFSVCVSPDAATGTSVTDLTVIEGSVAIAEQKNLGRATVAQSGQTVSVRNMTLDTAGSVTNNAVSSHALNLLRLSVEMSVDSIKATGLMNVTSSPEGADIFIQGKNMGKTPQVIRYPAGTYSVTLTHPLCRPWEQSVTVNKLATEFVAAQLSSLEPVVSDQPAAVDQNLRTQKRAGSFHKKTIRPSDSDTLTKDFGFITNPAFVEALVQMSSGEYQKAVRILDSLRNLPEISVTDKIRIMSKIAACYKEMGNFEQKLKTLTDKYKASVSAVEKGNLLWEIINVKANCLEDYTGAEQDILTYIKTFRDGSWIESAYAKLGEIQYITGKYSKAIGTFKYHISLFKYSKTVEKSMYMIANIMRMDINDYSQAIVWYTKLLAEYPQSDYFENALVERAECYEKEKQFENARSDYQTYLERFPQGRLRVLCSGRLALLN